MVNTDKTFITNENGQTLLGRFKIIIKDTRFFDVLVGYFYTSCPSSASLCCVGGK
jgi:hypothetical protein